MHSLWLLFSLIITVIAAFPESKFNANWEQYKSFYRKVYDKELESVRRLIWEENLNSIQKHNLQYDLGLKSFAMGMNEYSDLTHEEFKAIFLPRIFNRTTIEGFENYLPPLNSENLPTTVDWNKKGYVTPVKNQGKCGSCWAFSTTGSLEGQIFRKTKRLPSLSEQQLVDCSTENHGCQGGRYDYAFKYIMQTGGIMAESAYPYTGKQGQCRFNPSGVVAKCTGFSKIHNNEISLKLASASVGPISVAIDASHPSFQHYSHGVYYEPECSTTQLDHAVLVVGYGTEGNSDYWLVKNSWGPSWGDKGYLKMIRNMKNNCGIATMPMFPRA